MLTPLDRRRNGKDSAPQAIPRRAARLAAAQPLESLEGRRYLSGSGNASPSLSYLAFDSEQ